MITGSNNSNQTKSSTNAVDYQKYIGVAPLTIIALDPSKATLEKYGFKVDEEPRYIRSSEDKDGNSWKYHNLRILCAIKDDTTGVHELVSLYFKLYNEINVSKKGTVEIIDNYGNTCWATSKDVKENKLPVHKIGKMDEDYHECHRGESSLINFFKIFCNINPYEVFDRRKGGYVRNPNADQIGVTDWKALVNGDNTELQEMVNLCPNNFINVILGVRTDEDNKLRQTFISSDFIRAKTKQEDTAQGVYYPAADKIIKRWMDGGYHDGENYLPYHVSRYNAKPTEVQKKEEVIETVIEDTDDFPF